MRPAVVVALVLACCTHRAPSTTTTTAAPLSRPSELAVELRGKECAYALPSAIGFDERDDLDEAASEAFGQWAVCVGSPRLAGATVEITGSPDDARFDRRASRIRELLA